MVDQQSGRLIDYVHLNGMNTIQNLGELIADPDNALNYAGLWSTNRLGGNNINNLPLGLVNQVMVSLNNPAADANVWRSYGTWETKQKEIDEFRRFFGLSPLYFPSIPNTNLIVQVPFTPTRRVIQYLTWQANDPLVHYTTADLAYVARGDGISRPFLNEQVDMLENIGRLNDRYSPWGGNPMKGDDADQLNAYRMSIKDPLVRQSDDWEFPTNKFPNVGWLGRVHRGTPWQTVYLKATDPAPGGDSEEAVTLRREWQRWAGNWDGDDARRMSPVNDRFLFDVFTTAINDNAARGRLSINQTNLAAWSAVLSGVPILTNALTEADLGMLGLSRPIPQPLYGWDVVQPAGAWEADLPKPPVLEIVEAIGNTRTNFDKGVFHKLGDILAVPELTERSPFLNRENEAQLLMGINDAAYERIPQQILGLLQHSSTPRFVVYSYGQTLRPADRSVVTTGNHRGLVTNYQVTGEVGTRAVVRIEGAPNNPRVIVESFNVLPPD
jgi:hypothetical protein